jgi:riboflavin kinase
MAFASQFWNASHKRQLINSILPKYGIMIGPEDLECLKHIALLGGLHASVFLNSQILGGELGISPQTASRRLKALEQQNLIRRTLVADGQQVTISEEGETTLRQEYCDYYRLFGGKEKSLT